MIGDRLCDLLPNLGRQTRRRLRLCPPARTDVPTKKDPPSSKSLTLHNEDPGSFLSFVTRTAALPPPTRSDRVALLNWMIISNTFDNFLQKRFPEETLSNCETLVPAIKALILQANRLGVSTFVIGPMSQCGGMHILGSCFHVPLQPMLVGRLRAARGQRVESDRVGSGLLTACHSLSDANTHAMILGKTRAEQLDQSDDLGRQVWSIFLYSDCHSQGIRSAYEALQLSRDPQFSTRGIIHIIISDKDRRESRRWNHLDLAFMKSCPVIRVDSLDPEAVARSVRLAAIHSNTFQTDVFVQLEHPKLCDSMQTAIADTLNNLQLKKPVMKALSEALVNEKLITKEEVDGTILRYEEWYEEQHLTAVESVSGFSSWISNKLRSPLAKSKKRAVAEEATGVDEEKFDWILERLIERNTPVDSDKSGGKDLTNDKSGGNLCGQLYRALEGEITWTAAQVLAFAHLLHGGVDIRLSRKCKRSGECGHGCQRQDMKIFDPLSPFDSIFSGRLQYVESLCSEGSVLSYEVGCSQRQGRSLSVWQSDSPSLASVQSVLDEFLSRSGQWFSKSNLLVLVPQHHTGLDEGLVPKCWERVVDLCWEEKRGNTVSSNISVVNISSPSSYFHLIMKQANSTTPTIAFLDSHIEDLVSPKSHFLGDTRLERYIADRGRESGEEVLKVLFCSGSLHHRLVESRDRRGLSRLVAAPRLGSLVPFPGPELAADVASCRHASVHYLQEEHREKGWWTYVGPRLQRSLKNIKFNINLICPPPSLRSPQQLHRYRDVIINQALDIY